MLSETFNQRFSNLTKDNIYFGVVFDGIHYIFWRGFWAYVLEVMSNEASSQ